MAASVIARLLEKQKPPASMEENCVNKHGDREAVETTDIIIVGAGVAGAALAYSLGKDGRRVRVIERDMNAPRRIAGENLMPGGYLKLIELGLEDCVDEIDAQRFLGYVLYKDGNGVTVSFPLDKFPSEVAGRSFHNGRFVQKLRDKAASLHNVSLEQGTVTSLIEENGTVKGVHYKDKTDPSPILLYNISSTEVRCMVDIPSRNLPSVSDGEMAHYLRTLVAPKVPPELYTAFMSAIEKKDNIRVVPSKIMAAAKNRIPGALLIGDAFNMRHPLTGGGMTVALSDVVLLRDLLRPLRDLSDPYSISKYLESFYTLRKKVFRASSDPTMEDMQQAYFGYLGLGGALSNGVSAVLSGLCPRPSSLAFHFVAMTIYGVGRLLLPFPSSKRLWNGAKLLWVASSILLPFIRFKKVW
ncbi:hypothetical protein V6N13_080698 [Hibiscus sabdariffa]